MKNKNNIIIFKNNKIILIIIIEYNNFLKFENYKNLII